LGSKWGFLGGLGVSSWEELLGSCCCVTRRASSHSFWRVMQDRTHNFGGFGNLGSFSNIPMCSFWCVLMLFYHINLLEHILLGLKLVLRIWDENVLKMNITWDFSKTCFSWIKWWEYGLISITMNLDWSCKVYVSLGLGLALKINLFWKMRKVRRTWGILKNKRNL